MKEYPLTKGDMRDLAKTGLAATICFSFASGLFGFIVNLSKDLAFASNLPEKVIAFWDAIWWCSVAAMLVFAVFGGLAVRDGRMRIKEIEDETDHEGA